MKNKLVKTLKTKYCSFPAKFRIEKGEEIKRKKNTYERNLQNSYF